MISPDNFERSYRLDFPSHSPIDRIGEQTVSLVTGKLLKPRHYTVEVKYVHPNDAWEQIGRQALLAGKSEQEFCSQFFGYSVMVSAFYHDIFKRRIAPLNLLLNVLFDRRNQSGQLLDASSWVKMGGINFSCEYKGADYGTAFLNSVTPLIPEPYLPGLYNSQRQLKPKGIERLHLANKGIPEQMDWIKTFHRFATQSEPDGKPLTANGVYQRLLIPVSSY